MMGSGCRVALGATCITYVVYACVCSCVSGTISFRVFLILLERQSCRYRAPMITMPGAVSTKNHLIQVSSSFTAAVRFSANNLALKK